MWRRSLFWRIFFAYCLIVVFCTAIVGGYLLQQERRKSSRQLEEDLAVRARLLDERLTLLPRDHAAADSIVKVLGARSGSRVTWIAPDGTVLADSEVDPAVMENHRFRSEVQAAFEGRRGVATRLSASAFAPYLYVAVLSQSNPGHIVRVAIPLAEYRERLQEATTVLVAGGTVAVALAILLGFIVTRRITRPLSEVRQSLENLEHGAFGARLDVGAPDEIGQLARTLNRVQERLEATIESLTAQRNEREAILTSMVEGLLAVDGLDRVLLVNTAAREHLHLDSGPLEGRPLIEVARIPRIADFVAQVRTSATPLMTEIVLPVPVPRYLEMHGAPLHLEAGGEPGAVVVLNDVTRLRKLEDVRKRFVANVSHELKTPITTIKGFLETLLEGGALEDPSSSRRFLEIVARQSDRLAAILEDLLYLSRLEYEEKEIALAPVDLALVAERSRSNFEHTASSRNVELAVLVETAQRFILGDASLLARAVDNLVDNAIKYSRPGGRVEIVLSSVPGETLLQVVDRGIGIPEEHLPRITERFYRVDPARSREMGGTGLGLAIVKHIALVHRGRLEAVSSFGDGSAFTLRFPEVPAG